METIRTECGLWNELKGEVGEVRREASFVRIFGGKVVVFGAQRVLSLSRTRARMVGICCCCCERVGFSEGCEVLLLFPGLNFAAPTRCGPRSSGR